jgi:hypothetical protein
MTAGEDDDLGGRPARDERREDPYGGPAEGPRCGDGWREEAVARLLARADELAESCLEGIEDAARELAELAGNDAAAVSEARRVVTRRLESDATRHNKQVMSLIRRTLEVGMARWRMQDTRPLI